MINLPRSKERRDCMQKRLAALGLNYEILPAIDGRAEQERLAQNVDDSAFQRNVGRDVLPGEIGCYYSHLAAWERFLSSGEQVLLVLEDDVVFHDDFIEALQMALRARPHWDFLKLNKIRAKQPVCQGRLGSYNLNAYLGPATGLGAYLIQRPTVQRLLPRMLPITRPIDHELDLIWRHDFRHFGLEPFPSHVQDDGVSTITGERFQSVKRYPLSRRWPKYAKQFYRLLSRLIYLARRGRLLPRRAPLPLENR
ncbi:MAG: glycosyltransferase family 25 protein [Hydrogenophaga sp.]|nr:glycosyltransferase family 25 protein [Hydrogenophaga sp.]